MPRHPPPQITPRNALVHSRRMRYRRSSRVLWKLPPLPLSATTQVRLSTPVHHCFTRCQQLVPPLLIIIVQKVVCHHLLNIRVLPPLPWLDTCMPYRPPLPLNCRVRGQKTRTRTTLMMMIMSKVILTCHFLSMPAVIRGMSSLKMTPCLEIVVFSARHSSTI